MVTSYEADDTVVNEVQMTYGPYDTIDQIEQEHDGAVDQDTMTIAYDYALPGTGDDGVRRTRTTYPDDTEVTDVYNSGMDDILNRLSGRKEGADWIFQETYAGRGVLAERQYGTSSVVWSLSRDRFDRPDELIVDDGSTTANHYVHSYDFDSRLTFRENRSTDCGSYADYSEEYTYNGLGALIQQARGAVEDPGDTTLYYTDAIDCLTRDAAQNVLTRYVDSYYTCGTPDTFEFNASDEITERNSDTSWADYNDPGDMTVKGGSSGTSYKFDAWHRLVEVKEDTTTVATYQWNGLHQRVESGTAEDFYYGAEGEFLFRDAAADTFHVWGSQGAGDYVGNGANGNLNYVYVQDAHFNVVTWIFPNTGNVYFRFLYDAYWMPTMLSADWCSTYTVSAPVLAGGMVYDSSVELYWGSNTRVYTADLGTVLTRSRLCSSGFDTDDKVVDIVSLLADCPSFQVQIGIYKETFKALINLEFCPATEHKLWKKCNAKCNSEKCGRRVERKKCGVRGYVDILADQGASVETDERGPVQSFWCKCKCLTQKQIDDSNPLKNWEKKVYSDAISRAEGVQRDIEEKLKKEMDAAKKKELEEKLKDQKKYREGLEKKKEDVIKKCKELVNKGYFNP